MKKIKGKSSRAALGDKKMWLCTSKGILGRHGRSTAGINSRILRIIFVLPSSLSFLVHSFSSLNDCDQSNSRDRNLLSL